MLGFVRYCPSRPVQEKPGSSPGLFFYGSVTGDPHISRRFRLSPYLGRFRWLAGRHLGMCLLNLHKNTSESWYLFTFSYKYLFASMGNILGAWIQGINSHRIIDSTINGTTSKYHIYLYGSLPYKPAKVLRSPQRRSLDSARNLSSISSQSEVHSTFHSSEGSKLSTWLSGGGGF